MLNLLKKLKSKYKRSTMVNDIFVMLDYVQSSEENFSCITLKSEPET